MTYREWLAMAEEQLIQEHIEDAAADAWLLLEAGAHLSRLDYTLRSREQLPLEQERELAVLLEKRIRHIPVQQILSEAWFYGYSFYVNEHVLIPRLDTEVLVEETLALLNGRYEALKAPEVLDVCTGSGCIILTIKKELGKCRCTATDISGEALKVAKRNARQLEAEVTFLQGDLLAPVQGRCFDVIVSNPPYIVTEVIEELSPEVKDHEPVLALDGGTDGLDFYRRMILEAPVHLRDNGLLIFEIGYDQGSAVAELMKQQNFTEVQIIRDLAGKDRVVRGFFIKR